jgi:hypothetical protein
MKNTTTQYSIAQRLTSLGYSVATLRTIKKIAGEFKEWDDLQTLKEALKEIEHHAEDALTFDKNNGGIEK